MKRVTFLFLVLIMLPTLVFAGGQGEQAGTSSGAEKPDSEKTPVELYNASYAFPTERVTFSFWSMMGARPNYKKYAQQMIDDYQTLHPNVAIDLRMVPNQKRHLLSVAAYQAKNPGDLHAEHIRMALAYGIVDPAPAWVVKYVKENYDPEAVDYSTLDGEIYALPLGNEWGPIGANYLWYNKDHFANAGVKDPPKTLPELIEIAKKTTIRESNGEAKIPGYHMRFEGAKHFVGEKFLPFVDAYTDATKDYLFKEDYSDILIDSQAFIDALTLYQKMAVEWKLTNSKLPKNSNVFALGQNVMLNENAGMIVRINKTDPNMNWGVAPLVNGAPPYGNDPVGPTKNQLEQIVWNGTKHPDVVWDFNLFMRFKANDLIYAENMPSIPIEKANQAAPFLKDFVWYEVAKIMAERPQPQALYLDPWNMSEQVQSMLGEAVHEVCFNANADPATVLKAKAVKLREKLKTQIEAAKKK